MSGAGRVCQKARGGGGAEWYLTVDGGSFCLFVEEECKVLDPFCALEDRKAFGLVSLSYRSGEMRPVCMHACVQTCGSVCMSVHKCLMQQSL